MKNYDFEGEPYVVVERQDSGIGAFLLGAIAGAAVAMLFAPRSGEDTRRIIGDGARRTRERVRDRAIDVRDTITAQVSDVRGAIEDRIESARDTVGRSKDQIRDAIDAGRAAASTARTDLERQLEEKKRVRRMNSV